MTPAPALLRAFADVVLRVGLNHQAGQPLLITDPYEVQGVPPDALPIAHLINDLTGGGATIVASDPAMLRGLVETDDLRGFDLIVASRLRQMRQHLAQGGAFLFLTGGCPGLFAGLPAERLSRFDRVKWRHLGPLLHELIHGGTQWTLAPAVTSAWADVAAADRPPADRVGALWDTVLAAMRVDRPDPIAAWREHLDGLALQRDVLNRAHHRAVRYTGPGTDLSFELARSHQWCTAQLTTRRGIPFVVNLPTEEVFTAPHKDSAHGRLRVARPVAYSGGVIDGIELEFHRGRVVQASAQVGADLLQQLLSTDAGAAQIGEVAVIPGRMENGRALELAGHPAPAAWQTRQSLFHHTLLDENAGPHIALGDAYRFCSRALVPLALNSSQVHVDLPVEATVEFG